MAAPHDRPPEGTRRREAYDFICDELAHGRRSPSLPEIGRHLKVSVTRARQHVEQLQREGFITRAAGAQRAISVPAMMREFAIAYLRREGVRVDEDVLASDPTDLPHLQLPRLPPVRHIPDEFGPGVSSNGDDGTRAAAGGAPGPGAAPP